MGNFASALQDIADGVLTTLLMANIRQWAGAVNPLGGWSRGPPRIVLISPLSNVSVAPLRIAWVGRARTLLVAEIWTLRRHRGPFHGIPIAPRRRS